MTRLQSCLFLDRDGIINKDIGYAYKASDIEFMPGIFQLCEFFAQRGYLIIIVTNQSGIARGFYSEDDLQTLNRWLEQQFLQRGIPLTAIYHCPHHPEISGPCACRKPQPGMLLCAIKHYKIDPQSSIMIGDKLSDMQAAEAAKIGVKLLLSDQHSTASNPAYIHASNLQQALECLTQTTQSSVTTMNPLISKHIQQSIDCKQAILQSATCIQSIEDAAELCRQALQRGNKILIAGNGGSAADAQHIAAELVGRFEKERASMAAIAITTDTSALTAIANDYGYEFVFSRQVEGLGQAGDVFIGLSTSGNSANIVKAVEMAQLKNMHSISLCGAGGKLAELSEVNIAVPSARTAIIQESHIMIGHMLCALIEA